MRLYLQIRFSPIQIEASISFTSFFFSLIKFIGCLQSSLSIINIEHRLWWNSMKHSKKSHLIKKSSNLQIFKSIFNYRMRSMREENFIIWRKELWKKVIDERSIVINFSIIQKVLCINYFRWKETKEEAINSHWVYFFCYQRILEWKNDQGGECSQFS